MTNPFVDISLSGDKISRNLKRPSFIILTAALIISGFFIVSVNSVMAVTISVPGDYSTIQAAIDAATTSDTIINVAAGTYNENILINKPLTVQSTDGAIIDGISTYIVTILHSDVTFEGFTVTNPDYESTGDVSGILIGGWQYTPIPENVQILNNIVTQIRSESGTEVSKFGATGINVGTSKNVVISGNTITDIKNPGDFEGSSSIDHTCGINVWGDPLTGSSRNIVISNNIISDIKYNGIILEGAIDVQIEENDITGCESGVRVKPREGEISNVQIEENDITGCEYGISVVLETFTLSGLTINLNNFADNSTQVLDAAEALDIEQVLENNTFDHAVTIDRPEESLLHTIWSKIQDAIDTATTSDTINVAAGEYDENVVISKSLYLVGAGTETTTIDGNNVGNTVTITTSDVTLTGFKITGGYANGGNIWDPYGGVVIDGNGGSAALTNIVIDDNTIDSNAGNGIYVSAAGDGGPEDNIKITNCIISNNGSSTSFFGGITLTYGFFDGGGTCDLGPDEAYDEWRRPKNVLIEKNDLSNDISTGYVYGIYVNAGQHNTIRSNDIHGFSSKGLLIAASMPCTAIPAEYTTVEDNEIYNNARNGIKLVSWNQYNTFTGNNIYNNGFGYSGADGYWKYGFQFKDGNDNVIQGNTITDNALGGLYLWGNGDPSYTWYSATNNVITGNTISNHTIAGGHGIYIPAKSENPNSGFLNSNINQNNITNNLFGLENADTAQTIDAISNWWGDATGPKQAATNSCASGDEVSNNVDYTPWLDAASPGGIERSYNVVNINSSTTYNCIQDAIDTATTSDAINVAAGTYNESVIINKNNLTILGDSDSRPEITGGLKLDTDSTGLTFRNFYITGTVDPSKNSVVRMYGSITDLTIDNCVFDGENVPSRMGFTGGQIEGDLTVTNSEFKNIAGWAVLDTRSGSGGDGSAMGTVTFAHNNIHDCNGSIVFRGLSTDWTDNVYVYENTFENIGEAGVSKHWAAFEVNRANNVEIHNNEIRNVVECSWGEGQAMQLWKVGVVDIYANTIENNHMGIYILKWPADETYDISGILIYQNSFLGNNQYALSVEDGLTGGPVNTTNNWWGSAKPVFNTIVSGNVNYSPWYANQEMTSLAGTPDENNKLTLPTEAEINVTTSVGEVKVKMPAGLTVTGEEGWTGEIKTPEVKSNSSVTVIPERRKTATVSAVIEIGYGDVKLTFDKAVRISIAGQAGKYVGYSRMGIFTPITTICTADTQDVGNALPAEGDCKIDVWPDLVIWTKHFTKFIAYTQTAIVPGGGGTTGIDTIAPSISAISVVTRSDSATISWQTNESSLTWIVYGTSTDYGEESKTTFYTTSHSVTLSELSPETTYHYQIKSKDSNGNMGSYTDKTFTTSALEEKITGDINGDNKVDIADFNLLIVNWGDSPSNLAADLDGNDKVDIFDFNLLMINWW